MKILKNCPVCNSDLKFYVPITNMVACDNPDCPIFDTWMNADMWENRSVEYILISKIKELKSIIKNNKIKIL